MGTPPPPPKSFTSGYTVLDQLWAETVLGLSWDEALLGHDFILRDAFRTKMDQTTYFNMA